MLNAEQAQARLAELHDADWHDHAERRVAGLPPVLRHAAAAFIAAGKPRPVPDNGQEQREAARTLDQMPADDLRRMMTAVHPGLGPALARWWTDARRRPYLIGLAHRAFRAPRHAELTAERRAAVLGLLVKVTGPYRVDPAWLATWGACLEAPTGIGELLASAVSLGGQAGERTLDALLEVGNGEAGLIGKHVIVALLGSPRPQGWEFIERLLLAAQRQEGLRQAILESADDGHPDAFDRILATVLDNKLLRFAAAARAAGVWLGFDASVGDIPLLSDRVGKLAAFRRSERACASGLASPDPWDAYIALCARGMGDAPATMDEARRLAGAASADLRAAALRYASATGLAAGQEIVAAAVADDDIRVASLAASLLEPAGLELAGTFDALTALVPRLPAAPRAEAGLGVERAPAIMARPRAAARLAEALGGRPVADLLPWLPAMDAGGRSMVASLIRGQTRQPARPLTAELRPVVIAMLSDRSSQVRGAAIDALTRTRLQESEAPAIEALLTRAATDIRRGALTLLGSLPPDAVRASARRLAASASIRQREAAAELLGVLGERGCEDLRVTMTSARTPATAPRRLPEPPAGGCAALIVMELDELAFRHRDVPVTVGSWQGTREVLFGDVSRFPIALFPVEPGGRHGELVLGEVFRDWWADRPSALRGEDDGLDALRGYVLMQVAAGQRDVPDWWDEALSRLAGFRPGEPRLQVRQAGAVAHVLAWLLAEHAGPRVVGECLDAVESTLAAVPAGVLSAADSPDWRYRLSGHPWAGVLGGLLRARPEAFEPWQIERWYRLMRWVEQPAPDDEPWPADDELVAAAHGVGAATDDDVASVLLKSRDPLFRELTRRWRPCRPADIVAIADRVRDRVIEAELRRGDLPTPTSEVAMNIAGVPGVRHAARLLASLGDAPLSGGFIWRADSRDDVLSHLIRVSFPASGESGADLRAAADAAGVPAQWLIDLALYAPQWSVHVEEALGWRGLADGALWLHAHTKDRQWQVDAELRDSWAAMTAERTALSAGDLADGAVDVAWFRRAYAALGHRRWVALHDAAKNASSGSGHRRAQLFAAAMLGEADEAGLTARITGKRHQDSVRALGLVPLPRSARAQRAAVQRRYAVLREFERGSRQFGAMRRDSERTAVRIGIENLARTAGFPDPVRFTWAVEAQQAGDLANGPVTVHKGDATLTLSVSAEGTPELSVHRNGRRLRAVPSKLRGDTAVAALAARKAGLVRQAARVRASLEAAMVAQDPFTPGDLSELTSHPVVAPMLARLVWVAEDGRTCWLDSPADGGSLQVARAGALRIAHPADLVADGSWVRWQERLFAAGRRQPFKQVFREFYVLTPAEREASPVSSRYDGHQLQPRQALALLGTRGWVISAETGEAARAFHRHGLIARLTFTDGFLTPLEADQPMIDGVCFTRRGEHQAQPLDSVPGVVFSEAMRDLDLVVSVAHAGGVDPEATASTTDMRAALIRQTARLLKLDNIGLTGVHALIAGTLGEYSLHLGSGIVHRRPGGAVCIVPVGSQHRGRLFLPFADDDPKTAEIVAKALLLARDHEIKDPAILDQLRPAR